MRTVESLMKLEGRVYVYLGNEKIEKIFLENAEKEGFTFGRSDHARKPTQVQTEGIVAVNPDRTLNGLGFVGFQAFHLAEKLGERNIIRIDYEKYINGEENYCFQKKSNIDPDSKMGK